MKNFINIIIISLFLFACKSPDSNETNIKIKDTIIEEHMADTVKIDTVNMNAKNMLNDIENINAELDELLED